MFNWSFIVYFVVFLYCVTVTCIQAIQLVQNKTYLLTYIKCC